MPYNEFMKNIGNFYFDLPSLICEINTHYKSFSEVIFNNYLDFVTDVSELSTFLDYFQLCEMMDAWYPHCEMGFPISTKLAFFYMATIRRLRTENRKFKQIEIRSSTRLIFKSQRYSREMRNTGFLLNYSKNDLKKASNILLLLGVQDLPSQINIEQENENRLMAEETNQILELDPIEEVNIDQSRNTQNSFQIFEQSPEEPDEYFNFLNQFD